MEKTLFLLLITVLLFSCKSEPASEPTVVEKIATAHGIENFEDVEQINYTFNVEVNDSLRTSRSWAWKPQTHEVTLTTADSSISYNHKTEAEAHPQTDQKFINDQYWLLFPFHLVWDEMEYEHKTKAIAPISGREMQQLTVTYPPNAGYTPGDVYEVFFEDDFIIREWVYKSGGSEENPFAATWEDYEEFNGMKIAKTHRNKDGNFALYFTDVSVK